MYSNLLKTSIDLPKKFIGDILSKFSEIKVLGAGDDEEIDSLEHVALFDQN
mgnify:CR=1 FL=1